MPDSWNMRTGKYKKYFLYVHEMSVNSLAFPARLYVLILQPFYLSLTLSHTHTHSLSVSLPLSHTHAHTLPLSHTHTHTLTLCLSLSLSLTHSLRSGYFTGKIGSAGVDPMAQKIAQTAQLVEMNLRSVAVTDCELG